VGRCVLAALEFALMEEAQARRKEGDDGGSAMFGRVERRGGARFVVVFQESHETVLIIEAGEEVLAHRAGVAVAQSVQEPLVVAVSKPCCNAHSRSQ